MRLPAALRSARRARQYSEAVAPPCDLDEAEAFLEAFYAEHPGTGDGAARIRSVRAEIAATGTYSQTPAELGWAARVAWRHSARCSGRMNWRTLKIRDRRWASAPEQVAAETILHLHEATNAGRVRSFITVFAPDTPRRRGPRIANSQALRYAGYPRPSGGFLGDPANAGLTEAAERLGWKGRGTAFDILPLVVRGPDGQLRQFEVPPDAVLEVPFSHPEFEWFAELGLKWYAVPVICDMYLDAGGIRYPAAPFNGWYTASTEIMRDLGDESRYDMLPAVGAGMGLDMSSRSTLWPDEAAVQLAKAVQHSFREAGVMATDHHKEAERFMRFAEAEEQAGPWCADWSWINGAAVVPATTPTFHREYPNPDPPLKPGYFRHEEPALSA